MRRIDEYYPITCHECGIVVALVSNFEGGISDFLCLQCYFKWKRKNDVHDIQEEVEEVECDA